MSRLSAKANLMAALHHAGPQHIPYEGDGSFVLVDHAGRKPPRQGMDAWGVTWAPLPPEYRTGTDEPLESFPVAHPATTVLDLVTLPFPAGEPPEAFAGLLSGCDPTATLVVGRHGAGPLDRLCALLGMERALTALLAEPDAARAALDRIADYHVAVAQAYLAAGAEAGFLADDYAGQDGPYLRPAVWRRLILPGLTRAIEVYREAGAEVFFHTCGRADAFVPELLDAGVTVFNLQSAACDLPALKAAYGRRIGFFGGVSSTIMLNGAPADVARAVRQAAETLWRDGGLVLAPDQPLAYPMENVAAFSAEARRL
jgi:uroporphyrinogen decarboxylase